MLPQTMKVYIGPDKQIFWRVNFRLFSYPLVKTCVLGAQKNRLIETVLFSTTTYVLVEK